MKLWLGGEIQNDVADSFRHARNAVEHRINEAIQGKNYAIALGSWDCVAIIREDAQFKEITKYSQKTRDMDFRLKLDYQSFKTSDGSKCERMIFAMLCRSLSILKEKGVLGAGLEELWSDVLAVGRNSGWAE